MPLDLQRPLGEQEDVGAGGVDDPLARRRPASAGELPRPRALRSRKQACASSSRRGPSRSNTSRSCRRNGRSRQNSMAAGPHPEARTSAAAAAPCRGRTSGRTRRSRFSSAKRPSRAATGRRPRRRSGCRARGWRNRRRPPRRVTGVDRPAHPHLAAQGLPVEQQRRLRDWRPARGPWRSRGWCRRRSRAASKSFSSTMRTSGRPSASTVASAMALASLGSSALRLGEPVGRTGRRDRRARSRAAARRGLELAAYRPPLGERRDQGAWAHERHHRPIGRAHRALNACSNRSPFRALDRTRRAPRMSLAPDAPVLGAAQGAFRRGPGQAYRAAVKAAHPTPAATAETCAESSTPSACCRPAAAPQPSPSARLRDLRRPTSSSPRPRPWSAAEGRPPADGPSVEITPAARPARRRLIWVAAAGCCRCGSSTRTT